MHKNFIQLEIRRSNSSFQRPDAGFMDQTRKGKLTTANSSRLEDEGEDISTLRCLRCKCCKTYLSPRTCGFLSYLERSGRSRTSLSAEKTIQIIFYWCKQRKILESIDYLGISKNTAIDCLPIYE
ncbi:hypothetical protein RF11_07964 [Thelohanellus kitauei]|uniref:Uncharacterized protein n=1 Tax=Thelohanellus kitauei TaxID=669202 RepID=A0A0C2MWP0_THEKT|nr:hypothetical protein RF11_07964 [Thelohanellus kitauei]